MAMNMLETYGKYANPVHANEIMNGVIPVNDLNTTVDNMVSSITYEGTLS